MSRATSPLVKAAVVAAVMVVCGARVRATDMPACTREIARCLSACRAVYARRLLDAERARQRTAAPAAESVR